MSAAAGPRATPAPCLLVTCKQCVPVLDGKLVTAAREEILARVLKIWESSGTLYLISSPFSQEPQRQLRANTLSELPYNAISATKSRCDLIPTGLHTVAGLAVLGCATGQTLFFGTPSYPKKTMLQQAYVLVVNHRIMWNVL